MCEKNTKQIFLETITDLPSEKGACATKTLLVPKYKGLRDHPSKTEDIPKRHTCSPPVLDWLSKRLTQWSPSNWNYIRKCYSGIRKRLKSVISQRGRFSGRDFPVQTTWIYFSGQTRAETRMGQGWSGLYPDWARLLSYACLGPL